MIKHQISGRVWARVQISALLFLSVFISISFIFPSSANASLPVARKPETVQLTPEQLAQAACARSYQPKNTQAMQACIQGYLGGQKDGAKVEDVCPSNMKSPEACKTGFQKSSRGYSDDQVQDATDASQSYCASKYQIPSVQGAAAAAQDRLSKLNTCKAGFEAATDGKTKAETCDEFSGDAKTACETGWAAGDTGKTSGQVKAAKDSVKDPDAQVDCDTTLSSTLSWIACPIIDMGVNFSDFIFQDFVMPLLNNVPVSTETNDGAFKAWSQFRVLGNIILLGSLLAIVYAQARGPK